MNSKNIVALALGLVGVVALAGCGTETKPADGNPTAVATAIVEQPTPTVINTIVAQQPTPMPIDTAVAEEPTPMSAATPQLSELSVMVADWVKANITRPVRNLNVISEINFGDKWNPTYPLIKAQFEMLGNPFMAAEDSWRPYSTEVVFSNDNGQWEIHNAPNLVLLPNPTDQQQAKQLIWDEGIFEDVHMLSAAEGWAVGSARAYSGGYGNIQATIEAQPNYNPKADSVGFPKDGYSILLHYANQKWQVETGAELANVKVFNMQPVASGQAWLVARDATDERSEWSIWRSANGQWEVDKQLQDLISPGAFYEIPALGMASPDEGWVMGDVVTIESDGFPKHKLGMYHRTGGNWEQVKIAPEEQPIFEEAIVSGGGSSFSFPSPGEAWMQGPHSLLHYKNGTWTKADLPRTYYGKSVLNMVSATEGWILGWGTENMNGVVLHYQDGQLEETPTFDDITLSDMEMISADEGWIVGTSNTEYKGVILHYKNQEWNKVDGIETGALMSIDMVSPDEGWAAGDLGLLHYKDGTWSNYTP